MQFRPGLCGRFLARAGVLAALEALPDERQQHRRLAHPVGQLAADCLPAVVQTGCAETVPQPSANRACHRPVLAAQDEMMRT